MTAIRRGPNSHLILCFPRLAALVGLLLVLIEMDDRFSACRADDFENEPIRYATAMADNPISRLETRLVEGSVQLDFEAGTGYLKSLLEQLQIPVSSQGLVFSKTSLQRNRISPRTPRALYFNDDVYVGFCQNGDVLELSAADPGLGTVFYTLEQNPLKPPRFTRQTDQCLSCHSSANTRGVPGHLVRSVYSDSDGFPIFSLGTHRIDHSSPFETRWGGWYVTGLHDSQRHLGNLIINSKQASEPIDNTAGQNVTQLALRFHTSSYLTDQSDLVALMVLAHQAEAHNCLTRANFLTRQALHAEEGLNRALNEPAGHRWDSTTTRIRNAAEGLVKYFLFCHEAPLSAAIQGTTSFAEEFSQRGPRDSQGRSLRDFDLQRRLFKYPCSYLIYSRSFDDLPAEVKSVIWKRLWHILAQGERGKEYSHLADSDCREILEILQSTKPDFLAACKTFEAPANKETP